MAHYNAFMNSNIQNHIIISKIISSTEMQRNLRVWVWHVTAYKSAAGPVPPDQLYEAYHCASHPLPKLHVLLCDSEQAGPAAWSALFFHDLLGVFPTLERLSWPPLVLMIFLPPTPRPSPCNVYHGFYYTKWHSCVSKSASPTWLCTPWEQRSLLIRFLS